MRILIITLVTLLSVAPVKAQVQIPQARNCIHTNRFNVQPVSFGLGGYYGWEGLDLSMENRDFLPIQKTVGGSFQMLIGRKKMRLETGVQVGNVTAHYEFSGGIPESGHSVSSATDEDVQVVIPLGFQMLMGKGRTIGVLSMGATHFRFYDHRFTQQRIHADGQQEEWIVDQKGLAYQTWRAHIGFGLSSHLNRLTRIQILGRTSLDNKAISSQLGTGPQYGVRSFQLELGLIRSFKAPS